MRAPVTPEGPLRPVMARVQRALPEVHRWVSALHAEHAPRAVAPADLGFERLKHYLPSSLLRGCRSVAVDAIPFPPLAELDLLELDAFGRMPIAAITFGSMYFVHRDHDREALHFHELVHVVQWGALGFAGFLSTYAAGLLQHGYESSPLEEIAFDLQGRFERRERLPDVVSLIEEHATRTAAATAGVLRSLYDDRGG